MNSNFYFTLCLLDLLKDRCLFLTSLCSFMALYRVGCFVFQDLLVDFKFHFVELFYRFSNYCVFGALCKYFNILLFYAHQLLVQNLSTQFWFGFSFYLEFLLKIHHVFSVKTRFGLLFFCQLQVLKVTFVIQLLFI